MAMGAPSCLKSRIQAWVRRAADGEFRAVRAPGEGFGLIRLVECAGGWVPADGIPDFDRAVRAGGGEAGAIRPPGDRADRAEVSAEITGDRAAGGCIADGDAAIAAGGGGKVLAIRGPCEGKHDVLVVEERNDVFPGGGIEEIDGVFRPAGDQFTAIRRAGGGHQLAAGFEDEIPKFAAAGGVPGDGHAARSAGEQAAAIATPANGVDGGSGGEGSRGGAGDGIADFHRAIETAGGERFAIGGPGERGGGFVE